jgi:hypothetical protein
MPLFIFKGRGENQQAMPEGENSMYYDIITLLDEVILPSLSYMDCNCCIAEEVWNIVKLYPYQCRLVLHVPRLVIVVVSSFIECQFQIEQSARLFHLAVTW